MKIRSKVRTLKAKEDLKKISTDDDKYCEL